MNIITEEIRLRQLAVEYAIRHSNNAKAAIKYHTSRQQIKRWRDRYDGSTKSLLPKSRRPHSHPNQQTEEEKNLIMKKYKKYGYEGLAEVYVKSKQDGYNRSYDSMCKLIRKQSETKKVLIPKKSRTRYEVLKASYPGEKVQIDIKYVPIKCIRFGYMDQKYYQITAIDEYSRKRVLKIVDEKSTYQTSKFLGSLEEELGFKIKTVQTDNGMEFTNSELSKETLFEKKLKEFGINYKKIRPYSPWQNGKVERSHRLDSKYYENKEFISLKLLKKGIKKYCSRYNNISRKVLGFKSPNEVIKAYNELNRAKTFINN